MRLGERHGRRTQRAAGRKRWERRGPVASGELYEVMIRRLISRSASATSSLSQKQPEPFFREGANIPRIDCSSWLWLHRVLLIDPDSAQGLLSRSLIKGHSGTHNVSGSSSCFAHGITLTSSEGGFGCSRVFPVHATMSNKSAPTSPGILEVRP